MATGTAEDSPRCMVAVGSAASGTTSVVSFLLALAVGLAIWAGRWKVGGRPGGVYCVPAST